MQERIFLVRRKKNISITTFQDLVNEASMLPCLDNEIQINPRDELEKFFFRTAEKHGVIDDLFSGEIEEPIHEEF